VFCKARKGSERTHHIIDYHQEVLLRIRERIPLGEARVPAPDTSNPGIETSSEAVCCYQHAPVAVLGPVELPAETSPREDEKAQIVRVGQVRLGVEVLRPPTSGGLQFGKIRLEG
jgi:hypothetical protein